MKKGSKGNDVQELQNKLLQMGYPIAVDGDYGAMTDWAVKNVQAMFGYDIDGIVGPATISLIDAQIGYGWNATAADAHKKALAAQGLNV